MKNRKFSIVLIPGLFSPPCSLNLLRRKIEREGYICVQPNFGSITMLKGELQSLEHLVKKTGQVVIVGHSAGGLLGLLLALTKTPGILGLINLGTPIAGLVSLPMAYYEARSVLGRFLPLFGPDEVKVFNTTHALLPFTPSVQNWVIDKVNQLDKYNEVCYDEDTPENVIPFNQGQGE